MRRAREAAGLSREELSRRLCMIGNKLELLERDEYDCLPGSLYVRGYIRNACKELGINAEPVLQAYAGYCGAEEESREILAHVSRGPVVQERKRSFKGLALLPLLVVGGVFWWMHGRDAMPPLVIAEKPPVEEAQIAAFGSEAQSGIAAEQSLAGGGAVEAPAEEAVAFEQVAEAALPAPEDAAEAGFEVSEFPAEEASIAAGPAELEPSPVTSQVEPATEGSAPAEAETAVVEGAAVEVLQLSFDEDSWVEVKDASGSVLMAKVQPAGSEASLTGQPPFQLMLGNASGTRVRYRGELVDSDPIGSRRTRRLTVGN
ncbi:RodZ domain-containing protein [Microbulbifer taiwanensis]|uniref:RodZ domain-containing protein n=1 Tax=Microbulbifer taiwanensis TaxID=986746 RepID=UPI003623D01F